MSSLLAPLLWPLLLLLLWPSCLLLLLPFACNSHFYSSVDIKSFLQVSCAKMMFRGGVCFIFSII
jgi:hypothetical protein